MKVREITFQKETYVLVSSEGTDSKHGSIALKEQLENGLEPYAHLYPNGIISRYGEKIGTIEDVTFLDIIDVTLTEDAIPNMREWGVVIGYLKY